MRAFVALPVPETLHRPLTEVQAVLGVGRLMPPENWHVTLAFLDEQPTDRLEEMHEALTQIALPGFDLQIRGLGVFGTRKPRLLYAAIPASDPLIALRRAVHRAARQAGIALTSETFHPHITLARFSGAPDPATSERIARTLSRFAPLAPPAWHATQISLYRSQLSPTGAQYDSLADYPLPN